MAFLTYMPPFSVSAMGGASFIWCKMCCQRTGTKKGDEDDDGVKHVKYYTRMSESDSNIELNNIPESDHHH